MVECPKCHYHLKPTDLIKEWNATPNARPDQIHVTIQYWKCPSCSHKFRTATRTWPSSDRQHIKPLT